MLLLPRDSFFLYSKNTYSDKNVLQIVVRRKKIDEPFDFYLFIIIFFFFALQFCKKFNIWTDVKMLLIYSPYLWWGINPSYSMTLRNSHELHADEIVRPREMISDIFFLTNNLSKLSKISFFIFRQIFTNNSIRKMNWK